MAKYITRGIHTRTERGELKIFHAGSEIVPTKLELAMFPNKFVELPESTKSDKNELSKFEISTLKLEELKSKLETIVDSGEWADEVVDDAKKFLAKNPEKQNTLDELISNITNFLNELDEVETNESEDE